MATTTMPAGPITREHRVATRWWLARVILGSMVLTGATAYLIGFAWDIQWHLAVGRDRPFIVPHLMVLSGIAISGLAALSAILVETVAAHGNPAGAPPGTTHLGSFQGPRGAYLAGFGALASTIAFPLDNYWHSLYGIDVSLWAPFHVMITSGMMLAGLGAVYILASAANLAERAGACTTSTVVRTGVLAGLASVLGLLFVNLTQAVTPDGLRQGLFGPFALYPILVALFGSFVLVGAALSFRWPGAATGTALVYLLLRQVLFAFVPPAVDAVVRLEGQTYRPTAPIVTFVPFAMPQWLILAAVLLDLAVWLARRRGWPLGAVVVTSTVAGFLVVAALDTNWMAFGMAKFPTFDGRSVLAASLPWTGLSAIVGSWLGVVLGASLREEGG
jgi:hypothetical protein